jgi:hypothetical protein
MINSVHKKPEPKKPKINWILIVFGGIFLFVYFWKSVVLPFEIENKVTTDTIIYKDEDIFEIISTNNTKMNFLGNMGLDKIEESKYNEWICNTNSNLSVSRLVFVNKMYKECEKWEFKPIQKQNSTIKFDTKKTFALLVPATLSDEELTKYCTSIILSKQLQPKTIQVINTVESYYIINNPNYKQVCLLR